MLLSIDVTKGKSEDVFFNNVFSISFLRLAFVILLPNSFISVSRLSNLLESSTSYSRISWVPTKLILVNSLPS